MDIECFITTRRILLALWTAKQQLLETTQSRFPTSHPVFKAILRLCHNDATCQIRHLCDVAICKCADRFGDEVFRDKIVDDVNIPAVTHFFYGISHLIPREILAPRRTKQFTASDVGLFEEVYRLGRGFIESAFLLPLPPSKELHRETTRFEKAFGKARAQMQKSCALYAAYLHLEEELPKSIVGDILTLSSE